MALVVVVAPVGVADDAVGGHDLPEVCVIAPGLVCLSGAAGVGVVPADQGPVRAIDPGLAGVRGNPEDRVQVWA